jgi:hypothetical protein
MGNIGVMLLIFCAAIGGCGAGGINGMKTVVQKFNIKIADDKVSYMKTTLIGECVFYSDNSYDLNVSDSGRRKRIADAIDLVMCEGKAHLHYEDREGGAFIMHSREVKKGEKDFVYALVDAAQKRLNFESKGEIISFEYRFD